MVDKARSGVRRHRSDDPATEKLFGPYRWGRYDLLVLPPSFPFGGMENPKLTFATPTSWPETGRWSPWWPMNWLIRGRATS